MDTSEGQQMTGRRITRTDRDSVTVLSFDHPERSMNVVDEEFLRDLRTHLETLAVDPTIEAVVLASAKPGSFGAGADVTWLPDLARRSDAEDYLASVHALMHEIVTSPRPFVAAINGPAYGGALEIALATEAIVACPDALLGLPEISLGLLPGGAGTQLILRWLTTDAALDLMLEGRPLSAQNANALGLVTALAPADKLIDAAIDIARDLVQRTERRPPTVDSPADAEAALSRRLNSDSGPGPASGATAKILEAVSVGVRAGFEAGCKAERAGFLSALASTQAKALMHLFVAESEIKRRSRGNGERFNVLGVIGGGQMGAGIAATAVSRGMTARVRDISTEKLADARAYLDRVLSRLKGKSPTEELASRWSGTNNWEGFHPADAVVEAVFELPDLKLETLERLSREVSPHALLATNTSAIPIHTLAPAVRGAERFIGMHFFSPVDRMPLVELVPHAGTSQQTVHRAAALGRQMGKVPVVVADAPGFFTSRVYARWLIEGIRLLLEGADPAAVDTAAKSAGFPVGPLQAHDEATLDLVLKASISQVAEKIMTDRLDVAAVRGALETLTSAGVLGRRPGTGFYNYENNRRTGSNPDVPGILGVTPVALSAADIGERLVLAFASECFLCWDDGTLCHPDDGDVASVLGIGFPRVLGGPFHWADESGLEHVLQRCRALGEPAFPPGATLPQLARSGARFADAVRRARPGLVSAGERS